MQVRGREKLIRAVKQPSDTHGVGHYASVCPYVVYPALDVGLKKDGQAVAGPSSGEAAIDCPTRLSNTHSTAERRILYEFHPWSGQEVAIDRVVTKGGVTVARCRLPGGAPSPLLLFGVGVGRRSAR